MVSFGLLLLLSLSSKSVGGAKTIVVDWFSPLNGNPLPPITAMVDDTIRFDWNGFHNVFLHPTASCAQDGAISVGGSTGATYTFVASDAGKTLTFACDVGSHCESGQILDVAVAAADSMTMTMTTTAPNPSPPRMGMTPTSAAASHNESFFFWSKTTTTTIAILVALLTAATIGGNAPWSNP